MEAKHFREIELGNAEANGGKLGIWCPNSLRSTNFDVDWVIQSGYKVPSPLMPHYRPFCCIAILCFIQSSLAEVDFDRDIRPLLSDTCFQCHGPDAAKREADLRLDTKEGLFGDLDGFKVVAPGDAEASELFFRIAHEDPEERMPPSDAKRQLKADYSAELAGS